jgi:hypothetical protein
VELRKLLVQPDTRILKRKLKNHCGKSTWEEEFIGIERRKVTKIIIYCDFRRDGVVNLVLHELLHVYMSIYLKISSIMTIELEEAAILAWERSLSEYLHSPSREKLLESWSKSIERKL